MADRYWVGGTGTWSSTNTTNWAASSGGAGGESVPTASDNVFFDAGSDAGGTFTCTMANTPRLCNDFTASGLDFTMTLAGTSIDLTVSGSLAFPATNFTRTYIGITTFNATTTGKTITTNGVTFGSSVLFDGVGGAWTLGSAISTPSGFLNVVNGTFDTSASNYAVTAGQLFSSNSNVRTIKLNGSTITCNFGGTSGINLSTGTNLTFNAGTSSFVFPGSSVFFNTGGGLTFHNVSFTSTAINQFIQFSNNSTFNNLTFPTLPTASLTTVLFNSSQTINGTLTATGADGNIRILIAGNTFNLSPATLTCAAVAATDVDFRDITIAGAASPLSGTRLGDCGGNSGITFGAGVDKYWNLVGGGNWNANAWATSSGGAVANTNFPLAQDTVIYENTGLNTSATVTINVAYNIGNLNMSTRSNAMTLATGSISPSFYGNFAYSSAVTPTGTGTFTFRNRSINTLDSGGVTFTQLILIDAPNGGIQLINNNFTSSAAGFGATNVSIRLNRGTIDLNNLTMAVPRIVISGSLTRGIIFGTGSISCTGTGTGTSSVLQAITTTNLTLSGSRNVFFTTTSAAGVGLRTTSFTNEAQTFNCFFTGGTYSLQLFETFNGGSYSSLDFTGFAGTLSNGGGGNIYGNLTLSAGMTLAANNTALAFRGTNKTITSNGKTMDFPISFNGGGTFQLQDAMTLGSTRLVTFQNGTVDLNGFTLTSGTGTTASGTKNITFKGGTLLLGGSGATAWNNAQPSGFTTTAGTGTGAISMTSASAKTFVGGGSTYNCNLNQGGAGDLTITGSNTFNDIKNSVQPATILFTAGTTQTVSNFTLSGTSGNLITIDSTSASQFTLSKASGTVSVSFVEVRDSIGTGGAVWEAFTSNGNVDGGNNTGWIFGAVTSTGNMFMMFH